MPTYFPQINTNFILTQLPYISGFGYDNIDEDLETGMRWSFARRANTLLPSPQTDVPGEPTSQYSITPLGNFQLNYPNITDDEASTLQEFFYSMKGKWGQFALLDPSGNLLGYSENYDVAGYWTLTDLTLEDNRSVPDPFGGSLASTLETTGADCYMEAPLGGLVVLSLQSLTGLNGYMMCVSVYVQALQVNQTLFIGFKDTITLETQGQTFGLPLGRWVRISFTAQLWSDNAFNVIFGGNGTFSNSLGSQSIQFYGAQVSPMKGSGAYIMTPTYNGGGFGYHPNVRFDTDSFTRQIAGPNQNAVVLPCWEFNITYS